jgi:hypothetical protein
MRQVDSLGIDNEFEGEKGEGNSGDLLENLIRRLADE